MRRASFARQAARTLSLVTLVLPMTKLPQLVRRLVEHNIAIIVLLPCIIYTVASIWHLLLGLYV
jgi:hypothetical protein